MASLPKDPPEDPKKQSFWMVRDYIHDLTGEIFVTGI